MRKIEGRKEIISGKRKQYYINRIIYQHKPVIALLTSDEWTGEGNFCGWYSVEYYKNINVLAYYEENTENKTEYIMETAKNPQYYKKIQIFESRYSQKTFYAENDSDAVLKFIEIPYETNKDKTERPVRLPDNCLKTENQRRSIESCIQKNCGKNWSVKIREFSIGDCFFVCYDSGKEMFSLLYDTDNNDWKINGTGISMNIIGKLAGKLKEDRNNE